MCQSQIDSSCSWNRDSLEPWCADDSGWGKKSQIKSNITDGSWKNLKKKSIWYWNNRKCSLSLRAKEFLHLKKLFQSQTSIQWLFSTFNENAYAHLNWLSFLMLNGKQWTKSRDWCYSIFLYFQTLPNDIRQLSLRLPINASIQYLCEYFILINHHLQYFFRRFYFQIKYSIKSSKNITEIVFLSCTFGQ